jgi:hypothetical protein
MQAHCDVLGTNLNPALVCGERVPGKSPRPEKEPPPSAHRESAVLSTLIGAICGQPLNASGCAGRSAEGLAAAPDLIAAFASDCKSARALVAASAVCARLYGKPFGSRNKNSRQCVIRKNKAAVVARWWCHAAKCLYANRLI